MSHAFSGKGGGILGDLLGIGASLLVPGLGAAIMPELGVGEIGADAIAGAGLGAATAGITGGNILEGAAIGGIGGGFEGAGGIGGIAKDVGLDGVGNAISSGFSDVGDALGLTGGGTTDSLGVTGGVAPPVAPSGGTTAPISGVDSLSDNSVQALNSSTSGGDSTVAALGGLSSSGGINNLTNPGQGISGANIGGFQNAPDVSAPSVPSGGTSGLDVSSAFESGGGATYNSALNSGASSNASSASIFSAGPKLEGGGGIQSSTGVAPMSESFFSDLTSGDIGGAIKQIPLKDLGGVAGLAYQAISGSPPLPKAEKALLGQLSTAEGTALNEYNSGVLTAPQQAELDQMHQNLNNATYQRFASAGITNPQGDSRFTQEIQQNSQQVEAAKQKYLDQAMQTAQGVGSDIQKIGADQMTLDTQYSKEINDASKALFDLLGN